MTTYYNIETEVRNLIAEKLGIEPNKVGMDSRLCEDLGADSLDAVDLVMSLEEKYDIEIPDEEAEKMQTVRQVVEYLEKEI